ncbi:hypothetical protein PGAL8A_00375600 [Plasmodium gallinaceum]|uniref:Gametocyte associated protein n=1 Tax=Plasmodium gallinaceum TaxID=5849 RepID=A0A1J1GZT6_PLAGA|nr:hypothetical protein PGAL8A_00375600 [Plasmodium gallinaceum]CRG96531.1 hypothetical protein PGAL8A_00375600 [Plasmodium gallinaceum]
MYTYLFFEMKIFRIIYFFCFLYVNLWTTILYDIYLFLILNNDIFHKYNLDIWQKTKRNLAEASRDGLKRKRTHDDSLTDDESLHLSVVCNLEYIALKMSTQMVIDASGDSIDDTVLDMVRINNTVRSLLDYNNITLSEEKIQNMALRISDRFEEMFSSGSFTLDKINNMLKFYMIEAVLSYNLLRSATSQPHEDDRISMLNNVDGIKYEISKRFNHSNVLLSASTINNMALRIRESVQDLLDAVYTTELPLSKNIRSS